MTIPTLENTTYQLMALLPLLGRTVAAEVRREIGEDTTMAQYRTLDLLAAGPTTLSVLARQRRVSLQSMGEVVQSLVERGLITRVSDSRDRRQHLLELTAHGGLHHESVQAHALQRLLPLLEQLSAEEIAAVGVALPALQRILTGDDERELVTPLSSTP